MSSLLLSLKSVPSDKTLFSNWNEAASHGFSILEKKSGVGLPAPSQKIVANPDLISFTLA